MDHLRSTAERKACSDGDFALLLPVVRLTARQEQIMATATRAEVMITANVAKYNGAHFSEVGRLSIHTTKTLYSPIHPSITANSHRSYLLFRVPEQ